MMPPLSGAEAPLSPPSASSLRFAPLRARGGDTSTFRPEGCCDGRRANDGHCRSKRIPVTCTHPSAHGRGNRPIPCCRARIDEGTRALDDLEADLALGISEDLGHALLRFDAFDLAVAHVAADEPIEIG